MKRGLGRGLDSLFGGLNEEETAKVEEAFAKLGEAYEEFKEYGIVDASSLVELQEIFKNVFSNRRNN